jgi:hypothetical protein
MLTFRSKSAPYAPTTGRSALLIKRITRMTDNAG